MSSISGLLFSAAALALPNHALGAQASENGVDPHRITAVSESSSPYVAASSPLRAYFLPLSELSHRTRPSQRKKDKRGKKRLAKDVSITASDYNGCALAMQWESVILTTTTGYDSAAAVASDTKGNIVEVGAFPFEFGGGPGRQMASYDKDGTERWENATPNSAPYVGVACDSDNNISAAYRIGQPYGSDMVLEKLSPDYGSIEWSVGFGSSLYDDYPTSVAVDRSDNSIVVAGRSNLMWEIVKFNSDGTLRWSRSFPNIPGAYDTAYGVAVSPLNGDIVVVGDREISPHYVWTVRALSAAGGPLWSATSDVGSIVGVAVDASGNSYVSGQFGGASWAIRSYDSSGTARWTRTFCGGTACGSAHAVAVDDSRGFVYVAGDGGNSGDLDWFLRVYDLTGNYLGSVRLDGTAHSDDTPFGVSVGPYGQVAVAGNESDDYGGVNAVVAVFGSGVCPVASAGYPQHGHQVIGPGGINTLSGNLVFSVQDLSIPFAGLSINLIRTYNSQHATSSGLFSASGTLNGCGPSISGTPFSSVLGPGWTHSYQVSVRPQFDTTTGATLYVEGRGDGREIGFTLSPNGIIVLPPGIMESFTITGAMCFISNTWTGQGIQLRKKHGLTRSFDSSGNLMRIDDPNGNSLVLTHSGSGVASRLIAISYSNSISTTVSCSPVPFAGTTVYLDYDDQGRLIAVHSPDSTGTKTLTTTYGYDGSGFLISVTATPFYQSQYTYYGNGCMSSKVEPRAPPGEKQLSYSYDAFNRVYQVRTPAGVPLFNYSYLGSASVGPKTLVQVQGSTQTFSTTYAYDNMNGVLTEVKDPYGNKTEYAWDANLNQIIVQDANSHSTTYFYDSQSNVIKVVDALGGSRFCDYDATYNHLIRDVDANGNETKHVYDGNGNMTETDRVVKAFSAAPYISESATTFITAYSNETRGLRTSTQDPAGHLTSYGYDTVGNMTSVTRRLVTGPSTYIDLTTTYEYDKLGRRAAAVDPNGSRTEYQYDDENRLTTVRYGVVPSTTIYLQQVAYEYDSLNRMTKQTGGCCRSTTFDYNNRDQVTTVTDALAHVTTNTYDVCGDLLSVEDHNHHVTSYSYDLLHRLTQVADAATGHANYTYDNVGNLLTANDPNGKITTYSYDALNRVHTVTQDDGKVETFTYDALGNRQTAQDAQGGTTTRTWTYDSLSRPRFLHITGNATAPDEYLTYDKVGNRTKAITTVDSLAYTLDDVFDSLNRLTQENIGVSGGSALAVKQFAYDGAGNRLSMVVDAPNSTATDLAIGYTYDAMNRVLSVTGSGGLSSYQYDANGLLVHVQLPNQVAVEYSYDLANRLTRLRNARQPSGAALSFFEYTYDNMENPTSIRDAMGVHQYSYDALDRLTQAAEPGVGTQAFTYDPAGNRLTRTMTGQTNLAYAYNGVNELLNVKAGAAETDYAYDEIGNLLTKTDPATTRTHYTFDALSRLTQVSQSATSVTYGYDPDGRRMHQTSNGTETWFVFDGLAAVMELNASRTPTAVMVPGISKTKLDLPEPFTEYYLHDGLGSVVMLTDDHGNPTQMYLFDPFGTSRNMKSDAFNRYRFVGLAQDDVTSLTYMNARWYDPGVGRFISRDPISGMRSFGTIRNPYEYASSNPLAKVDATGLDDEPFSGGVNASFMNLTTNSSPTTSAAAVAPPVSQAQQGSDKDSSESPSPFYAVGGGSESSVPLAVTPKQPEQKVIERRTGAWAFVVCLWHHGIEAAEGASVDELVKATLRKLVDKSLVNPFLRAKLIWEYAKAISECLADNLREATK